MIRMSALPALLLCVGGLVVAPGPAAHADPTPGVYDVTTDRTIYPASGTMTVSSTFVPPAGAQVAVHAQCAIAYAGVTKWTGA